MRCSIKIIRAFPDADTSTPYRDDTDLAASRITSSAACDWDCIGTSLIDAYGGGSLFDEFGCFLWMRQVGHMAGIHFDRLGLGALRHHALLVRIDRPVCGGHHVPGGLGLPSGPRDLVSECVGGDWYLGHSHERRLILRNVRCKVSREML